MFTLQASYFSLLFLLLLLKFKPMSCKTLKTHRPVQNQYSCQDTEHLCLRLWIARFQMAAKCDPCLNQFRSMVNNCQFNKSVVYLIVTAERNPTTRDVQDYFHVW